MFCMQCGARIEEDSKFCKSCGAKTTVEAPVQEPNPVQPPAEPVKRSYGWGIAIGLVLITVFGILIYQSLAGAAHVGPNEYTIQISGTASEFQGAIGGMNEDGQNVTKSVSGKVPYTYTFTGSLVSVFIQNKYDTGTITVTISRNGSQVETQSSNAAYGAVTIATR